MQTFSTAHVQHIVCQVYKKPHHHPRDLCESMPRVLYIHINIVIRLCGERNFRSICDVAKWSMRMSHNHVWCTMYFSSLSFSSFCSLIAWSVLSFTYSMHLGMHPACDYVSCTYIQWCGIRYVCLFCCCSWPFRYRTKNIIWNACSHSYILIAHKHSFKVGITTMSETSYFYCIFCDR